MGVPQFHVSSLPHKRQNGTINGIPGVAPNFISQGVGMLKGLSTWAEYALCSRGSGHKILKKVLIASMSSIMLWLVSPPSCAKRPLRHILEPR